MAINCSQCGYSCPDDTNFCPVCGSQITQTANHTPRHLGIGAIVLGVVSLLLALYVISKMKLLDDKQSIQDFKALKKIGVVLKRAQYFITCSGRMMEGLKFSDRTARFALLSEQSAAQLPGYQPEQLSLFDDPTRITREDVQKCLTGQI